MKKRIFSVLSWLFGAILIFSGIVEVRNQTPYDSDSNDLIFYYFGLFFLLLPLITAWVAKGKKSPNA
jgi:uncharacterized membrane protein HdeD (DUF308 family)